MRVSRKGFISYKQSTVAHISVSCGDQKYHLPPSPPLPPPTPTHHLHHTQTADMSSEDGRSERAGSIASSHTEAGGHEDVSEKHTFIRDDESLSTLKSPTAYQDSNHDGELDHQEDEELLPQESEKQEPAKPSATSGIIWIAVNTLATVGIVSEILSCGSREQNPLRT